VRHNNDFFILTIITNKVINMYIHKLLDQNRLYKESYLKDPLVFGTILIYLNLVNNINTIV
jgi:hypothetical protein